MPRDVPGLEVFEWYAIKGEGGREGGKREGGVDKAGAKRERREKGKNRQEGST